LFQTAQAQQHTDGHAPRSGPAAITAEDTLASTPCAVSRDCATRTACRVVIADTRSAVITALRLRASTSLWGHARCRKKLVAGREAGRQGGREAGRQGGREAAGSRQTRKGVSSKGTVWAQATHPSTTTTARSPRLASASTQWYSGRWVRSCTGICSSSTATTAAVPTDSKARSTASPQPRHRAYNSAVSPRT
jgi:hypothetical protein